MAKFRKKPVVIDAWQWLGANLYDAETFQLKHGLPRWSLGGINGKCGMIIRTLEGDYLAEKGDFIIRGVAGEYYPCKPDIFAATYEPAE